MNSPSLQSVSPASISTRSSVVPALAIRAAAAARTAARSVANVVTVLGSVSEELRRMADDCEATRPEMAARLRRAARQGWGW